MTRPVRFLIRVGAMASKEVMHIRRDPRTLYMALAMPVVMLLIFGFGVSFDMDHIPLVVLDGDRSTSSRALVRAVSAGHEFTVAAEDWNADSVAQALASAGAQAVEVESGEPTLEDVFLAVVARPREVRVP